MNKHAHERIMLETSGLLAIASCRFQWQTFTWPAVAEPGAAFHLGQCLLHVHVQGHGPKIGYEFLIGHHKPLTNDV